MKIKRNILLGLILILLSNVYAAYLTNVPQKIVQPDGTIIHCFASGDEYHNWLHDSLGYTIIRNPQTGYYVYALPLADSIIASNYVVGNVNPVSLNLTVHANISPQKWQEKKSLIESMTPKQAVRKSADKNHGHINNLVFFLRFADESGFQSNTYQDFVQMHNDSSSSSSNSMYNFYKLSSYGKFTVTTSFYPSSSSNVIYSYQDSLPRNYYLAYDSTKNPDGYKGSGDRRRREHSLLKRVVDFFADSIPSDLDLDFDNDGRVDNICFVTSGAPEGWSGLMWPHRWSLSSDTVYIHGKRVYDYNFVMETTTVGVFTHEFMHTLGAPDLYRYYEGKNIDPVGTWDLMASTNYDKPQGMSAYMKYKYGNWIDTIIELKESGRYTLYPANGKSPHKTLYKIATSVSEDDYLVLDYRTTNSNTFESSIYGTGLLVYRINENFEGNANFNGVDKFDEVYLFRRNGSLTSKGYLTFAHFAKDLGRTHFGKTSSPYPFCSDGTIIEDVTVTSISTATADSIQFVFLRSDTFLITKDSLQLNYILGAKDTFEISANIDWELSNIPSWLTLNRSQGEGSAMIILTANENNPTEIRLDTIFLSSTSISTVVPIIVSQEYGTSIREISKEDLVEIFPNPVSDKLYINIFDKNRLSNISIYSITGQLVYHSLLENENEKIEIDVADLSSGVYFVKLHSQKHIISKRFIKK